MSSKLTGLRKDYLASFIISIDIIGLIGDKVVDPVNPDSNPVYELFFHKNRYRHNNSVVYFSFDKETRDMGFMTDKEIEAAKLAIDYFHKENINCVHITEYDVHVIKNHQ